MAFFIPFHIFEILCWAERKNKIYVRQVYILHIKILHVVENTNLSVQGLVCGDSGIDDEDATKFIYNNGNNAPTDNITAGVAA